MVECHLTLPQHTMCHVALHLALRLTFYSIHALHREVQQVARKKGLLCREAFHYREHPLLPRLQQLVSPPSQHAGSEGGQVKTYKGSGGAAVLASAAGTAGTGPSAGSAEGARTPTGGGGASSISSFSSNTSGRNSSGSAVGGSFRGGDGGSSCGGGDGGVLGEVQRIDVRLLIPKWVFGSGDIRWMEGLAGEGEGCGRCWGEGGGRRGVQ